ncbi:MAG: hypothetical protein NZN28_11950 [Meiothermus sp.]|uniref:hypothetical protein n=1 Tax=Meiothermus sp. TaxID=1955249 RepID=UPI0025CFBF98|nr:hypothetical protein [Meiothermus sp.]MCS7069325.1 hypothetical protein [Meiothermus sp.]
MTAREQMIRRLLQASSLFAQARLVATTPGGNLAEVRRLINLIRYELDQAEEHAAVVMTSELLRPEIERILREEP